MFIVSKVQRVGLFIESILYQLFNVTNENWISYVCGQNISVLRCALDGIQCFGHVISQLCCDICFMDLYLLTSLIFVIRIRLLELTCFYCFSRWRTLRTVNISLHHDTPGCFSFFVLGFNNAIYKEGNNIFLGFRNSPYRSTGFPWKTC